MIVQPALTGHAVKAKDETNEVLQCNVSRGGTITQSNHIENVITDPSSCRTSSIWDQWVFILTPLCDTLKHFRQ